MQQLLTRTGNGSEGCRRQPEFDAAGAVIVYFTEGNEDVRRN
jgi:hypothetical protein